MLKVLIKKELKRFGASLSTQKNSSGKKKRKTNGKGSKIAMICLWVLVFVSLGFAFLGMADMMGTTLLPLGLDWLYYVIIGIAGFLLSVIGNSFTAQASLFKAKDNDLLLSMPIPSRYIIISRLALSFVLCLVYTAVYMIPAVIQHGILTGGITATEIICLILMIIIMALVVTALSAALGWVLAQISKHIRNKAAATTVFTIVFLVAYYYFYFNVNKYLTQLASAAVGMGEKMEASVFSTPLIHFGKALCGNYGSVLVWLAIAAVLIAIVFRVLDKSFVKITTSSEKTFTVKYDESKQEQVQLQSPKKAMLRKEFKRFVSSPTYMINCGLGIIVMIAAAVMLIIKKAQLLDLLEMFRAEMPDFENTMVLIVTALIFMMLSMIDISSPSISLEGKNLWILKSTPLQATDIFFAKINLQLLFSIPPLVILLIALAIVFKFSIPDLTFIAVLSLIFARLNAQFGVFLGLTFPKLDWTNEAVPVKQSIAVVIAMFSGLIFAAAMGALYWFVVRKFADAETMIMILLVGMALGSKLFDRWFAGKGAEKLAAL